MVIFGLDSESGRFQVRQLIASHVPQKQLENDIYDAIHRIGRDAEAAAACAEKKAMNLGVKAVETGADIANKVAEEADKVKDKWEK